MDVVDKLIQQVLAAAEPALTPEARHFIESDQAQDEDMFVLDDALQAVVLAGTGFPVGLLDRIETEILEPGFADDSEDRIAGWVTKIRAAQAHA